MNHVSIGENTNILSYKDAINISECAIPSMQWACGAGTMKLVMNDEIMEWLIDTLFEVQKKESSLLPTLRKQLAEVEKGITNMVNAIQAGVLTESTQRRLVELEERKHDLEISIIQEEMQHPLLTREQLAFFMYRFREIDISKKEQRQRLIDCFVNAVYLYDDRVALTFNYKDGGKTVSLQEIEGSDLFVLSVAPPQFYGAVFLLQGGPITGTIGS